MGLLSSSKSKTTQTATDYSANAGGNGSSVDSRVLSGTGSAFFSPVTFSRSPREGRDDPVGTFFAEQLGMSDPASGSSLLSRLIVPLSVVGVLVALFLHFKKGKNHG